MNFQFGSDYNPENRPDECLEDGVQHDFQSGSFYRQHFARMARALADHFGNKYQQVCWQTDIKLGNIWKLFYHPDTGWQPVSGGSNQIAHGNSVFFRPAAVQR